MIDVSEFIVVSGMSGVYKVVSGRKDGAIIEDYDTKRRQFVAARSAQFSMFETISIYTDTDVKPLGEVFDQMKQQVEAGNPTPDVKASSTVLRDYFTTILPDHDRDRVHASDIKKIVKWFNFIDQRNLWKQKAESTETTESTTEA